MINPELDYYNYKGINNAKARDEVLKLINEKYLIDYFRENVPTTKTFTWKKDHPCKQARLDYFLISENLLSQIAVCFLWLSLPGVAGSLMRLY